MEDLEARPKEPTWSGEISGSVPTVGEIFYVLRRLPKALKLYI